MNGWANGRVCEWAIGVLPVRQTSAATGRFDFASLLNFQPPAAEPQAADLEDVVRRNSPMQIVTSNSRGRFDPTVLEVFQTVAPVFEAIIRENARWKVTNE